MKVIIQIQTLDVPLPELRAEAQGTRSIRLDWIYAGQPAETFIIERGTDKFGTFQEIYRASEGTSAYLDTELEPGITYYYWVKAQTAVNILI